MVETRRGEIMTYIKHSDSGEWMRCGLLQPIRCSNSTDPFQNEATFRLVGPHDGLVGCDVRINILDAGQSEEDELWGGTIVDVSDNCVRAV